MKVTTDKIENRQAYLTVEMEPAEVEEGLNKAYNRLVQKAQYSGFPQRERRRGQFWNNIWAKPLYWKMRWSIWPRKLMRKQSKSRTLNRLPGRKSNWKKLEPVTYKMVVPWSR